MRSGHLSALLTLGLFACVGGASAPPPPLNDFGARFAATVARHDGRGVANRLTSPIAEQLAFGMAANGTLGETQRKLLATLGYDGRLEGWNDVHGLCQFRLTTEAAPDDPEEPTLSFSNAAWFNSADPSNAFTPEFAERLRQTYTAEVGAADFRAPAAADGVNAWADRKSKSLIPKIIDADTLKGLDYLLVNLTYFAGTWRKEFCLIEPTRDPRGRLTQFTKADGTRVQHSTVLATDDFRLIEGDAERVVELPFVRAHGREFVFYAVLPNDPARAPAEYHSSPFWARTIAQMKKIDVSHGQVSLPKFSFDYEVELRETSPVVAAMDLQHLFESTADFRALSPKGAHLGLVKEVSRIELDEKGVKAAAAVVLGAIAMGVGPELDFEIHFDRPFAFAIAEKISGTLLFMGELQDPSN